VFGVPGVGKTLCLKFILRYLQKNYPSVLPVYVNLGGAVTEYSAVWQLGKAIKAKVKNGYSIDMLYAAVFSRLRTLKQYPIIILDEVDSVKEINWFLYKIMRNKESPIIYILISNSADFQSRLDLKTQSTFNCKSILFSAYTKIEIKKILDTKFKGVIADDILAKCSEHAEKRGDLRFAFKLLEVVITQTNLYNVEMAVLMVDHAYNELIAEPRWLLVLSFGRAGALLFFVIIKAQKYSITIGNVRALANYYCRLFKFEEITEIEFENLINRMIKLKLVVTKRVHISNVDAGPFYKEGHKTKSSNFGNFKYAIPFSSDISLMNWLLWKLNMVFGCDFQNDYLDRLCEDGFLDGKLRTPR
jgi:Cdc6-like AAA superfamily ATPase